MPGQCDEAAAHALMDKFVEMGGNFIDTADAYAQGKSEEIVGSWLQKQDREKWADKAVCRLICWPLAACRIVLATKVMFPMGSGPNDTGLSRKHITFAVEQSLKRLKTNYIDLYQVGFNFTYYYY